MSETVIKIEDLWKRYEIGRSKNDDTLAHRLKNILKPNQKDTFWALKEIDLQINRGDVLGIIGKNGAGKSTLLKLLSKITWPTKGRIEINGRLASLLEVGTGFHPELTGRENIFLNGTILGMNRREVKEKFDEIVWFSGVEKFIDTPVKHYSSGMYVRLAFAVAAHLEPEILVIDEVLAVGDAEFQKKCLGKMGDVAKSGRTVLFVSHNMGAVMNLCNRCIVLENGKNVFQGETEKGIDYYLKSNLDQGSDMDLLTIDRESLKTSSVILSKLKVLNDRGIASEELRFGEPLKVELSADFKEDASDISVLIGVSGVNGQRVFTALSDEDRKYYSAGKKERLTITAEFSDVMLLPGQYSITVALYRGKMGALDMIEDAVGFCVSETTFKPGIPPYKGNYGYIRVSPLWRKK